MIKCLAREWGALLDKAVRKGLSARVASELRLNDEKTTSQAKNLPSREKYTFPRWTMLTEAGFV